jgi:hypothetical protein
VAVNDLGWVAYKNDIFVLDLWGLGSEKSRQAAKAAGRTAEFMRDMTARSNAAYAMVYDDWFEVVPPEWCRIAQLNTIKVTSASDKVAFYLIAMDRETEIRTALQAFEKVLPKGASLSRYENCRF